MNTAEFLLATGDPGAVVLIDGDRSTTYAQLRAAAGRIARRIEDATAPGATVGILAPNSLFWVASYLAIMGSGRVAAPLATTTPPEEMHRQLDWVGAATVLAEARLARRAVTSLAGRTVITGVDADEDAGEWTPVGVAPDEDAVLQLTSGTTSTPKAVRVTHANLQANTASILSYLQLRADDRMLVLLPFPYCFGASLLHTHLRAGGSLVLCHTLTFPETVVDLMERREVTGLAGVPSTYQLLLRASSLGSRQLPSLRHLQQAGGRLAPALVDQLVAAQPAARVFVMYGQTEATARLSYLDPADLILRRGSIGRGLPDAPLRVVDGEDRDVAVGEVGEVVAVGDHITKGYWNDPEATAAKYRGGMLRTGDLGRVDEDGYIYLVDRISDFLKPWGIRVSSQEIEEAALEHPGVVGAGAVGVPDDQAGEVVVLFVVDPAGAVDPDAVLTTLRGSLAKHMVPERVLVLEAMPLNANGKPLKSRLRELAASAREQS